MINMGIQSRNGEQQASEIEKEARRLEQILQQERENQAAKDSTHRLQNQNQWVVGNQLWMPRYRSDYSHSGYQIVPSTNEARFRAGEIGGWQLELLPADPPARTLRLIVVGDAVIGRCPADIDLDVWSAPNRGVSRAHALLRPAARHIYLIDTRSTNGTFINGMRLSHSSAYPLQHNSTITFGRLVFTLKLTHIEANMLPDANEKIK